MAGNIFDLLGLDISMDKETLDKIKGKPIVKAEPDVFANPESQGLEGSMLDPTMLVGMGGAKALNSANTGLANYMKSAVNSQKGDIDAQKRLGAMALAVGGAKATNPSAVKNAVLDGLSMGTRSSNPISDVLDFVNKSQNAIAVARKTRMDKIAGKESPEGTALSMFGNAYNKANRKANNMMDFASGGGKDVLMRELKRNPSNMINFANRALY